MRPQPRRLAPWPAISVAALLHAGCAIESPKAPTFETEIVIPLSEQRITIAELVDGVDGIVIDSTGVRIEASGEIDSLDVDDELSVSVEGTAFASEVGPFELDPDLESRVGFTFGELAPPGLAEGTAPVPAFSFTFPPRESSALDGFSQATFVSGQLRLVIVNGLPVPISGGCSPSLSLRVDDVSSGGTLIDWPLAGEIPPGGSAETTVDLAGVSIGSTLSVELAGCTAGSGGDPVTIDFSDEISISVSFVNAVANAATARVPAQTFNTTGSSTWGDDLALVDAAIDQGNVEVLLENETPLAATVDVWFSGFMRAGQPVGFSSVLAAGSTATQSIDLAGATFHSEIPAGAAEYAVHVVTVDTGDAEVTLSSSDAIRVDVGAIALELDTLEGVLSPVEEPFDPVTETLEWPEEMEGLDPAAAAIEVEIVNGLGTAVVGQLDVRASSDAGAADSLSHAIAVAPGSRDTPVTTTIVIDETNSRILDLLALHPTSLVVSGRFTIGDGTSTVTLERGGRVRGHYSVSAPFAFSVQEVQIELDPKSLELEERVQDILREDIRSVRLTTRLSNGFPFGASGTIHFGSDSTSVFTSPVLELPPLSAAAAEVDQSSGKTILATESRNEVLLAESDLATIAQDSLYVGVLVALLPSEGVVVVSPEDEVVVESYLTIDVTVSEDLLSGEDRRWAR
jgi:hypothetical protein